MQNTERFEKSFQLIGLALFVFALMIVCTFCYFYEEHQKMVAELGEPIGTNTETNSSAMPTWNHSEPIYQEHGFNHVTSTDVMHDHVSSDVIQNTYSSTSNDFSSSATSFPESVNTGGSSRYKQIGNNVYSMLNR